MGHLIISQVTSAPIERAFRISVDPAYLHDLMPSIHDIREVHGAGDHVGDDFRFTDTMLGLHPKGRAQVTAADPPRSLTAVTRYDNGVVVRWTMRFTPALEGTEIENEIDYEVPGGPLGRAIDELLFHRLLERRLRSAGERFLEVAEATEPAV
jgi:ligand-binding SRPBCC domain-containing protein